MLPVDCGDGLILTSIREDGEYTVIFEYRQTDFDSRFQNVETMKNDAALQKFTFMSSVKELDDFTKTCFKLGRTIEFRYLDKFNVFICSYTVSPEEYDYSVNLATEDWICPKAVIEELIAQENETYPCAFSSDSKYENVSLSDDDKELVYEIRCDPMSLDELCGITRSALMNYITENWAAHSAVLRELAELDNLTITYKFKTSSGSVFHTIKVGSDKYSQF